MQLDLFSFNEGNFTELTPIIKWTGGKETELPYIKQYAPHNFVNYYEPFVGGGSVFAAFNSQHLYINDKSGELIQLYKSIASQNPIFFSIYKNICESWISLLKMVREWDFICKWYLEYAANQINSEELLSRIQAFIEDNSDKLLKIIPVKFTWHLGIFITELKKNLSRKLIRMKKLDAEREKMTDDDIYNNVETAFMSSLYMYYRYIYNDAVLMNSDINLATAIFLFIRNFSYGGMFRYNEDGKFNVPYGGIAYNHKDLDSKVNYYKSKELVEHFKKTTIENLDFEDFFRKYSPNENDFVFLDPPYDSEFSTYANNEFTREDQKRLANYLINVCKAKWMMIIKYTDFIYTLYDRPGIVIKKFDKKYQVSFMNRNDKNVEHLVIMNYTN